MPRPRSAIARARIAVIACAALVFAACGDATAPPPAEGAPDEFAFNVSALEGGTSTSVTLEGATVVVTHLQWRHGGGTRTRRLRTVPSAAGWAAFWATIEQAGVRQWTGDYEAEGFRDGSVWSLRLARNGEVIESHGANAYPDGEGREHHLVHTPEFSALLNALEALTGWEF